MQIWTRALDIADQTPLERNRYVDLLRAVSIAAVVLGHWIMAAPSFQAGTSQMNHLLDLQPWSRWLTWVFQVMPVFFFVGGFSNGVSWDSAQRKGLGYAAWLDARLRRLLGPTIPLVTLWLLLALIGDVTHVHPEFIRIGSQISLVPVWFLAIYFVIVMLVPVSRYLWSRFGFVSVVIPFLLAVLGDWLFFNTPYTWAGWFNYLFIWGGVHQLGYAWQQNRLPSGWGAVLTVIIGFVLLVVLTHYGPYPLSLVGVPSQELSNTTPPKLPLLALAVVQIGVVLLLEKLARGWLSARKPWAATVLVNGFIMPIFLWHSTVMMLLIALVFWLYPLILSVLPGSSEWWLYRPVWLVTYGFIMTLLLPVFLWSENLVSAGKRRPKSLLVTVGGAVCICAGLAILAAKGIAGEGWFGVNWHASLAPIIGLLFINLLSASASASARELDRN